MHFFLLALLPYTDFAASYTELRIFSYTLYKCDLSVVTYLLLLFIIACAAFAVFVFLQDKENGIDSIAQLKTTKPIKNLVVFENKYLAQLEEGTDVTAAKVTARITKLVNAGAVVKEQVTVECDGKKSKKMAYKLNPEDSADEE